LQILLLLRNMSLFLSWKYLLKLFYMFLHLRCWPYSRTTKFKNKLVSCSFEKVSRFEKNLDRAHWWPTIRDRVAAEIILRHSVWSLIMHAVTLLIGFSTLSTETVKRNVVNWDVQITVQKHERGVCTFPL